MLQQPWSPSLPWYATDKQCGMPDEQRGSLGNTAGGNIEITSQHPHALCSKPCPCRWPPGQEESCRREEHSWCAGCRYRMWAQTQAQDGTAWWLLAVLWGCSPHSRLDKDRHV